MHKLYIFSYFFRFPFVPHLQFSIPSFVILHQFSNSNYVVPGITIKNFPYVNACNINFPSYLKQGWRSGGSKVGAEVKARLAR